VLYACLENAKNSEYDQSEINGKARFFISNYFKQNIGHHIIGESIYKGNTDLDLFIGNLSDEAPAFSYICNDGKIRQSVFSHEDEEWKDNVKSVYIPANEILTYAKSILALNNERYIPFDQTEIDILSKAELGITKKITPNAEKVMDRIRDIIGGEVVYENDEFFIDRGGVLTPFGYEAGGYKKLGLLWKLLRNGMLEDGTYLFWDEPENNINPELIPVVVDTLLALAKGGVQVFVTSHDEIMARYFDIREDRAIPVEFHGMKKTDIGITHGSASRYLELPFNPIEDAGESLFRAVVESSRRED
jgi:hypothetical protein